MQKQVCIHFKKGKCLYGDGCYKQHSDPTKNLPNAELAQKNKVEIEPSSNKTQTAPKIEPEEEGLSRKAKKKKESANAATKVEPKCEPSSSFEQEEEASEVQGCDEDLTEVEPVEYVTEVIQEER